MRRQQIVAVPNDRFTRDQCLNNASFCAAVDPIMVSGQSVNEHLCLFVFCCWGGG